MKRLFVLLLAIVFCCTLLVGCGKSGANNGDSKHFSKGLEYNISGNREYYVVSGIGTCTDKDVDIPSTYKNLPVVGIGEGAFSRCTSLTSITIPDSVTIIGEDAFGDCTSLTSVTIPDSVTSIGWYALGGCTNLTSITYDGTIEEWNAISKDGFWIYNTGNYTIYCTDGEMAKDGTVTYY